MHKGEVVLTDPGGNPSMMLQAMCEYLAGLLVKAELGEIKVFIPMRETEESVNSSAKEVMADIMMDAWRHRCQPTLRDDQGDYPDRTLVLIDRWRKACYTIVGLMPTLDETGVYSLQ